MEVFGVYELHDAGSPRTPQYNFLTRTRGAVLPPRGEDGSLTNFLCRAEDEFLLIPKSGAGERGPGDHLVERIPSPLPPAPLLGINNNYPLSDKGNC